MTNYSASHKKGMGEVLRLLRIINDLSIREIAEILEVSPTYISAIENGTRKATMQIIERYSEALNISKSTILYFDEEREKNNYNHKEMLFKMLESIVDI